VLAAIAIDRVLQRGIARRWLATIPFAALLGLSIDAQWNMHLPITGGYAIAGMSFFLGAAAFVWTRSEIVLAILVVAGAFHYGSRLLLVRRESEVRVESELVDAVRAQTADGTRFAWIGGVPKALPCNEEAWLGLASIHSYDSLSSERYQNWILGVSAEGARTLGRKFDHISDESKLDSAALRLGGVSTLLSTQPLRSPGAQLVETVSAVHIYRAPASPLLCAQLRLPRLAGGDSAPFAEGIDLDLAQRIDSASIVPIERMPGSDDHQRYRVSASDEPTLVWLSQQFHPRWIARSGEVPLRTLCVDGFYQGVIVPPRTREIDLEFRPWSRWSWLPQLFFAAAAVIAAWTRLRGSRRRAHT
jgi:hypothetical protein